MVAAWSICWYVSGVPQEEQNVRRTGADEEYSDGAPLTTAKLDLSRVIQGTTGAAEMRLHVWQWQIMLAEGCPTILYRTAPHAQPPRITFAITEPPNVPAMPVEMPACVSFFKTPIVTREP